MEAEELDLDKAMDDSGISRRLEEIIVDQSSELLQLQYELGLYKHLYGDLTEDDFDSTLQTKIPQKGTQESVNKIISTNTTKNENKIHSLRTSTPNTQPNEPNSSQTKKIIKGITSNDEISKESTVEAEKAEKYSSSLTAIENSETPGTPSAVTLRLSQNHILDHDWIKPKKSSVLFGSQKLITVHNYTSSPIYVTVYDRVRMGISGRHVRVSPVFKVEEKPVIFAKPFLRSSRSLHLLFCRDVSALKKTETEINEMKFQSFPQLCIDFSNDIVIETNNEGSLVGLPKAQWDKQIIQKQLEQVQTIPEQTDLRPSQIIKVRNATSLSNAEKEFLKKRQPNVTSSLEAYLGESLEGKFIPRIAFCGSGGGCRSMVSTLGFMIGMENTGLLDCLTYAAGVSGSTWTIALWISLGISPIELKKNISTKFQQNLITRPNSKGAAELMTILKQKWTPGNRALSLVDIYGAQLSAGLLHDTRPAGCEYKLSHQVDSIENGELPMPIYTAVQRQIEGHHSWFEFSPYEVGSRECQSFVPTPGFGRTYRKGESTDLLPEPSLGLLLGTFGSAFCAPLQRVAEELFNAPASQEEREKAVESGYWMKTVKDYKDTVERVINSMQLQHTSFLAGSKFNNFAYDPTVEASRQRQTTLELYDAGIDGNLPFPVLFRPEREIDIIIACNSSKYPDINRGRALREAKEWAERENIKFPPIDHETSFAKFVNVYSDPEDPDCPVVIYLPLKHNDLYSEFDPQEIQRAGGYCSTFNFNMTKEQIEELSGLSQFNITMADPVIKETIKRVIETKTKHFSEPSILQS